MSYSSLQQSPKVKLWLLGTVVAIFWISSWLHVKPTDYTSVMLVFLLLLLTYETSLRIVKTHNQSDKQSDKRTKSTKQGNWFYYLIRRLFYSNSMEISVKQDVKMLQKIALFLNAIKYNPPKKFRHSTTSLKTYNSQLQMQNGVIPHRMCNRGLYHPMTGHLFCCLPRLPLIHTAHITRQVRHIITKYFPSKMSTFKHACTVYSVPAGQWSAQNK